MFKMKVGIPLTKTGKLNVKTTSQPKISRLFPYLEEICVSLFGQVAICGHSCPFAADFWPRRIKRHPAGSLVLITSFSAHSTIFREEKTLKKIWEIIFEVYSWLKENRSFILTNHSYVPIYSYVPFSASLSFFVKTFKK